MTGNLELSTIPVRHVREQNFPQRDASLEPMQPIERHPELNAGNIRTDSTTETIKK